MQLRRPRPKEPRFPPPEAPYHGIVEGFYWHAECAVERQYGEFDHEQRLALIEFMGKKGLNTYAYDPKVLRGENFERAYSRDAIGNPSDWRDTFKVADQAGVQFLWGLAPGRSEFWIPQEKKLIDVMNYLLDLGAHGFILLFDDVAGAATRNEIEEKVKLVNKLFNHFGDRIVAICPGRYYGGVNILDTALDHIEWYIPNRISLILTGTTIWMRSLATRAEESHPEAPHFPKLDKMRNNKCEADNSLNRQLIAWDNWVATDSDDPKRLDLRPPNERSPRLFCDHQGYLLNPCFPVERIVPMVSAVAEMLKQSRHHKGPRSPDPELLLDTMAEDWADFLGKESYRGPLRHLLAIRNGEEIRPMEAEDYNGVCEKWPSLRPVFETVDESKV